MREVRQVNNIGVIFVSEAEVDFLYFSSIL